MTTMIVQVIARQQGLSLTDADADGIGTFIHEEMSTWDEHAALSEVLKTLLTCYQHGEAFGHGSSVEK